MGREDLSFASPCDQLRIVYYCWPAVGAAHGVVQIAHGLGEHALRYAHVAAFLNEAGFHVYANDHRGHGQTAESPDSYGDFGERGWNAVVSDTAALTSMSDRTNRIAGAARP